ncbi:hypothetical protein AB4305_21965 [Nocardia sp. 2YAB30]|uniref:effector-associated constant component EACC1 n=1 Tax=unclassified Nocardia TaxID=2637762 RepID=UPI002E0F4756|nr:hypothetical protein OHB12_06170 [Nocardia sp. NBC_01730]
MSLRDWLAQEPEFRGCVQARDAVVQPEHMGALEDVLIVALGGGGAATLLAKSISIWLQQRRSGISVRITAPDGTNIEVTGEGPAADEIAKVFGPSAPE